MEPHGIESLKEKLHDFCLRPRIEHWRSVGIIVMALPHFGSSDQPELFMFSTLFLLQVNGSIPILSFPGVATKSKK